MEVFKKILLIAFLLLTINLSFCQNSPEKRVEHFNLKKTIAISGYDAVSYFSNNPAKGSSDFSHTHNGVIYLFASTDNKKTFMANPSKYEPAYGGWCAYAMSLDKSSKVAINPKTYKIIDDKLFLFYNKLGINTKEKWDKEGELKLKTNADKNWNNIISE